MSDITKSYEDLRDERDKLKAELKIKLLELDKVSYVANQIIIDRDHWRILALQAKEYTAHETGCIRTFWEAGEPTSTGGYRTKYAGKWYESRPVDREPKCTCGLDEMLATFPPEEKKP